MSSEAFESMTPAQRRVAIAKDVIASLHDTFCAATGAYVVFNNPVQGSPDSQLCDLIKGKSCQVCARGAMFVAAVLRFNDLKIEDMRYCPDSTTKQEFSKLWDDQINDYEDRFFDSVQIAEIETAFEQYQGFYGSEEALVFGLQFADPRDRMIAIMNNIIANEGTFVPSQLLAPNGASWTTRNV